MGVQTVGGDPTEQLPALSGLRCFPTIVLSRPRTVT
jgi:hypothetical protein